MSDLKDDIGAYEAMAAGLEASNLGEWVLVHDAQLVGLYATFEAAAATAVQRFGRGPYLIRQVGAEQVTLPASIMFQPFYEADGRRL